MKGILLLNGEPYGGEINSVGARVYCCDGAYLWAKDKVRIDKNVGDFDSLDITPTPPPEEIYPSEKNFTDGEIALFALLDEGIDELEIYGGFGGREDHFLGNLHLLYATCKRGVKCAMIGDKTKIYAVRGRISLGEFKGFTISVLPFGESLHIMGSEGLKYEYPKELHYGECRGISNIVLSANAYIELSGTALIIVNRGKV